MIDAVGLTKKFGDKTAVDDLSFSVRAGMVTGFLGPNGAGKSTTMRLILGLDHPTSGQTRVNGRSYSSFKAPMTEIGALLEAKSVHPGRSARSHLMALAASHGIPSRRVDEVIDLVGLTPVARKRAGGFSLGMSQRLGLAAALLGDPETLVLDEPVNGLDPEGVAWVRNLVRYLADEGRTVFISSHLMSEVALTADHVIIIGRGRLIADAPMSELIARASGVVTRVRSPQASQIADTAHRTGRTVVANEDGTLTVNGWSAQAIGEAAARQGWVLYELTPLQRSLEDVYLELTNSAVEFHGAGQPGPVTVGSPATAPQETPAPLGTPAPAAEALVPAPITGPVAAAPGSPADPFGGPSLPAATPAVSPGHLLGAGPQADGSGAGPGGPAAGAESGEGDEAAFKPRRAWVEE